MHCIAQFLGTVFESLANAPNSPDIRYAQWLVGDTRDVSEPVSQR